MTGNIPPWKSLASDGSHSQIPPLVTLHRYFIWANQMRVHFDEILLERELAGVQIESFLYMSYWYAGLYVVIEGWRELDLTDDVIDAMLQSPNVDLLRRYRNGVFHFQKEYNDERFMTFMKEGNDSVSWVPSLNQQFGRYFLDVHRARNAHNHAAR
jgi:hypothetical protein